MGGEGHAHADMSPEALGYTIPPIAPDASYFTHDGYSGMIMAHIVFMTLAWVFALPISVMLSISKSRYTSPSQFVFLSFNALGLLFGTIYNANTPDLYENNAHHKIGWIATWAMCAQTIVGLLRLYARTGVTPKHFPAYHYKHFEEAHAQNEYRWSHDSGQGTEPDSPRSSCPPSPGDTGCDRERISDETLHDERLDDEKDGLLESSKINRYLSQKLDRFASSRLIRFATLPYAVIDRTILFLGFITLATGIVTYGGHFKGNEVFSGLAHFIKGGIFFWYGLLTLGRVMGSFSDLGWSWNVKPPASIVGSRRAAAPSAEFVESLLIFVYGSTNVFLEHLGSTDGQWTPADLEHVSISVLFFGGGLCGMLIESKRIRRLLNSAFASTDAHGFGHSFDSLQEPRTYGFSTNPMPAIIILLLGLLMSSHHQLSPVSTMMHKQWGSLFLTGALARGVSYVLVYVSPPTSFLPSRPPSEIVVAFCLISGGLLFMGSASDIITGMEMYGLNAMFLFTVMMGFTALLMGWEIIVLAIKGWAVHREQKYEPYSAA